MNFLDDMESVLITEEQLKTRVAELGKQLSADYADKNPIMIGVLKGSFVFMADLIRAMEVPCTMDFMAVSSYGNSTKTTGAVKINKDLSEDIEGRDVIIVEDILDSGVTLSYLRKYLMGRGPASIRIVTLLNKPEGRRADIDPDYYGFIIPNAFVVGYGLDYAEKYRQLPYVGILSPSVYE